jgi:hypothetical protein
MGFAKNGLASNPPQNKPPGGPRPSTRGWQPNPGPEVPGGLLGFCACVACSFLIYPPTSEQRRVRAGGFSGRNPTPQNPFRMGFAKKTGSRVIPPRERPARRPTAPGPRAGGLPTDLPYTCPNSPTQDLPQPAYPTPPSQRTLHLPPE